MSMITKGLSRTLCLLAVGALPLAAQAPARNDDEASLLELLNTPVVSASKSSEKLTEAPATMIVLTRRDLETRGYTKFYEILDDLPGFDQLTIYGDTFLKTYARGYRNYIGDSILVMVDGLVYNHLWYNTTDDPLACFPLASLERVEVVYGPASAVYGANAFMGVINLITTKGGEQRTSINANLIGGSLHQSGIDLSYVQKMGDWRLSLATRIYHGDMDGKAADRYPYTSGALFLDPNGWGRRIFGKMLDTFATGETSPYTQKYVDVRLANGPFEFGATYLGVLSGYGMMWSWDHYIPNSARWEQPEWSFFAKASFDLGPNLNTTAMARYRKSGTASDSVDYEVDWARTDPGMAPGHPFQGPGFYVLPEYWGVQTTSLTYSQDFEWKASPRFSLNFGAVASQEVQQKNYGYSPDNKDDSYYWYLTNNFNGADLPRQPSMRLDDDNHFSVLRRGVYLQGKVRLDDHQSVILGARNDWQSVFGGANTLRLGYVGNWGGWSAKALYGQAYNEPPGRMLGAVLKVGQSSANLVPERSNTTEVSLGYTERRWSLLGDLYHIVDNHTIVGSVNVGQMTIDALDIHANLLFPGVWGKEQKLWAYATHHFKQTSSPWIDQVNVANSQDVGDIAKDQFHFGWTGSFMKDLVLTLRARHFGERQTVSTNQAGSIPAYTVVDAYAQMGLGVDGLSVGLKATNLLDKAYAQPGVRKANAGLALPATSPGGDYLGSGGYNPSLLPQAGRAFEAMVRYQF